MTASTARELADALQDSGAVRSPWLRRAFAQTPREVFVPRFYRVENGQDVLVDPTVPERRAEWLRGVYTDEALVVQVTPAPDFGGPECLPTSSSSMPTVMAGMLEALDLRPGHRVLEIGTGTGYNAALLCGRVGDQNVVSVELDPQLAEAARRALATFGLWPSIHAADGMAGVPDSAPFDRIIATAAVDHIPSSWITQLAPGGMILTDLRGSLDGALVRLSSMDDDTVQGRFLNVPAAFMPMRVAVDSPCRQDARWDQVFDKRNPHRGTTTVDPSVVAGNSSLRFLLQLHLAGRRLRGFLRSFDETELAGYSTDGSWCAVDLRGRADGSFSVAQGGPGRLWDTVETCWALWRHAGEPSVERLGVTATDVVDMQNVWLDHPASEHQWPLPL